MGLFLVKERTKQGSAIGGPERFQGMAILLDSYKNGGTTGNFPLVSFKASMWNEYVFGSMSHPTYLNFLFSQAK